MTNINLCPTPTLCHIHNKFTGELFDEIIKEGWFKKAFIKEKIRPIIHSPGLIQDQLPDDKEKCIFI
jgi:hypothetical protein